jgi:hypothetical protein
MGILDGSAFTIRYVVGPLFFTFNIEFFVSLDFITSLAANISWPTNGCDAFIPDDATSKIQALATLMLASTII